jgi:hypothetical protein
MLGFAETRAFADHVRNAPSTGTTATKEHGMLHRLVERWQPRPAHDPPQPNDPVRDGLEFAWRIHDTVSDVSGSLDIKASIMLTVETAAAAALFVVATSRGNSLAELHGPRFLLLSTAAGLLLSAIILAALVVTPRLSSRWSRAQRWRDQIIYYGALRQWELESSATIWSTSVLPASSRCSRASWWAIRWSCGASASS